MAKAIAAKAAITIEEIPNKQNVTKGPTLFVAIFQDVEGSWTGATRTCATRQEAEKEFDTDSRRRFIVTIPGEC
jgi:hypothetical protein